MTKFDLTSEERAGLFRMLIPELESYYSNTSELRVTPPLDPDEIRKVVRMADFNHPENINDAVRKIIDSLRNYIVHTPHPRYYGLFNPRPNFPSVVADLLTAAFNPQLAAWSHSPFAAEVENYLISEFGRKVGFPSEETDGVFATGGAEANITAVLCALNNAIPGFANEGLFSLKARPVIYCSSEAHHSVIRAARTSGLGKDSVRMIDADAKGAVRPDILEKSVLSDRSEGYLPFMVIGTAGTTGTGSIDDLHGLASVAQRHSLWYHIDAAWGGAAVLNPETRKWVSGIEKADSVIIDVHKWLSVPMSSSMFITRHREILGKTFRITTDYMPKDAEKLEITDAYTHSIQWSRRFIGLKLYLSLMVFGWRGYSEIIEHQTEMGNLLRKVLRENGWIVINHTPLPLVCFTDEKHKSDPSFTRNISEKIIRSGEAWVSVYPVNGISAIRACITNYNTSPEDINALVKSVNKARIEIIGG
ncbi:MAG: pyridoxal-dependent decarboxylase [Bacteroidales bacterium]|nr:pyridoxal-dependent decarboxylase [Bacteroidales bacterium]